MHVSSIAKKNFFKSSSSIVLVTFQVFDLAHVTTPLPIVVDSAENIPITAENGQQVMLSMEGLRDLYGAGVCSDGDHAVPTDTFVK